MEVFVLGNGFPHSLTRPTPFPFPKFPSTSLPPPTRATQITQFTAAATAATAAPSTEHRTGPLNAPKKYRWRRNSNSYLQRQSAIRDIQRSRDLISALERHGDVLQVQDMNAILRHFGTSSRWQDLSKLFEWMQQQGKINAASYTSFMKLIGLSLNPVKALEIYNSIQDDSMRNNAFICNSLLRCLVKNGKLNSSFKLFHQMKQNGLKPDAITYSSLLTGCMKTKDGYSKALELVEEMKHNGLQMDGVIYGSLLAVCAASNHCEEAESYFNQMKDEGHSPNEFHYSSLLNAYSTIGDCKKADTLVQDMKSAGLEPNKVILTTLLKVYVRGHMFDKARELLTELEALGYAKDEMPYCLLMDGLAKAGHIDKAKLVFEEMKEKSVESGGYSHSIMISAFCRGGPLEEATQLARDFETKYGKYDLVMINTMLNAYCRAGEMESVMQMLRKMDESAIVPNYTTFKILIKYYFKEKLYLLAYRTMEDMHRKGYQVEEQLCSSLISHLGKIRAQSEAFSVYNMLRYSKRTMCKAHHEKILHILISGKLLRDAYVVVKDHAEFISRPAKKKFARAFMKFGNVNLINDVMKVIHSSGCVIDDEIFQMTISRYIAEPEKKELLLQLLQWMPSQGYIVNSSTKNEILKNSHLFGRQLIVEALAKQHKMMSKTEK